jgi:hypothetical protein
MILLLKKSVGTRTNMANALLLSTSHLWDSKQINDYAIPVDNTVELLSLSINNIGKDGAHWNEY